MTPYNPIVRNTVARPRGNVRTCRTKVEAEQVAAAFAINGRFMSRSITGVQRYGREIVLAMDQLALERKLLVDLYLPRGAEPPNGLGALRPRFYGSALGLLSGHAFEQGLLPMSGARLLNLCNTAPVLGRNGVLCIHDANVFEVPESYTPTFRRFYTSLHPLIARLGTRIATVSHDAARRLSQHLRIEASTITVAANGHEHALRWKPELATARPSERPYVLLIGSLARHKNIARVLDLAEELDRRGLDVLIAGAAGTVFAAEASQSSRNVRFLGCVTDHDLASLLKSAVCLAFPSLSEGFGLPMLEAMVWGCPVVASRSGSLPEVGGDACLYADADDGAAWLAQFDRLLGQSDLADGLRHKGRERAKKFSWARSAAVYLDLMA